MSNEVAETASCLSAVRSRETTTAPGAESVSLRRLPFVVQCHSRDCILEKRNPKGDYLLAFGTFGISKERLRRKRSHSMMKKLRKPTKYRFKCHGRDFAGNETLKNPVQV